MTQTNEARIAALEADVAMLKERLEQSELERDIEEGFAEIDRGEGLPAIETIQALARKHGIPNS